MAFGNSIFKYTSSLFSTNTTTTLPDYDSPPDYSSIDTTTKDVSFLKSQALEQSFIPTSILQIQAQGKVAYASIGSPAKELETPIIDPNNANIGPKYTSIRAQKNSGNCVLVQGGKHGQEGVQVASTTYKWGPGKPPVIRISKTLQPVEEKEVQGFSNHETDEFELHSKSMFKRTVFFDSQRWGHFEWRYADRKERAIADTSGNKSINNLLVLEKVVGNGHMEQRIKVAQLVRGEGTRTPGTSKNSAGNGGQLEMCLEGSDGPLIDDVTVVVSCLVMLKKEIDNLRGAEIAVVC
ncbi:uncharacterized protein LY89DRAFT_738843 [Mollisia scopiformis]|uniref:Uncharacterized protein n=1 Tax=Mollisia scopiformis TaxID=149040 RepID=A0A194WXB0_MOLSC|nr:uncharacterized protein LY89DRAFT_738843 [Mollisia scopiformis]KUJ12227.1 hypothetical protein LY89DRAFT_738843 [Mollisia scopiformis]